MKAVIACIEGHREKVQRLVDYCRELDGTELTVVEISKEVSQAPKYPDGAELVRIEVMRKFYNQAFLWLEVDSIPLKPGWLAKITKEYRRCGKPFMLPDLTGLSSADVASGIGVYPPHAVDWIPESFTCEGWDGWLYRTLPHAIHFTRLIQHSYCLHDKWGRGIRKHRFPQDNDILRDDTVIFHADPYQTLLQAEDQTFYHSGDLGDIIAALPVIRQMGGGKLIFGPHTMPGKTPREGMNKKRFDFIAPLLLAQPYITGTQWYPRELFSADATHDFSGFRRTDWNGIDNLAQWQARHLGITDLDQSPWLEVETIPNGRVIVARSLRYQNPRFPWRRIIEKFGPRLLFVGLEEEHAAFQKEFDVTISRALTSTALDVAEDIAGSELGFYNQTLAFWIAVGLGAPLVQESWMGGELNSIVQPRNKALYVIDELTLRLAAI